MTEQLLAVTVQGRLAGYAQESAELRVFPMPGVAAQPEEVREALVDLRARLDRLEEILSAVTLVKLGTAAGQKAAEEEAQDAWDRQADHDRNRQVRDYEGAEERYARWRVSTFTEIRAARQKRVLADQARQVEGDVKRRFYGLRDIRGELIERGRQFMFDSNLDH